MVSPLAKESTPPRKHFQQLRTFWEKKRSGTPNEPTFVSAGEKKRLRINERCDSESVARNTRKKKKSPRQFGPLSYHRSLEVMSLYHTYIAPRQKADSVIQGITIPSQINQRMKKTVPIFNLHEYSCLAPHTKNNYINKLSCLYIYRTKKLLVRSTCVGTYLIIVP